MGSCRVAAVASEVALLLLLACLSEGLKLAQILRLQDTSLREDAHSLETAKLYS